MLKPPFLSTIIICITLSATFAQNREIKIVAHRGARNFAPENTIASFLKAAEMGADYAEMDIRQTRDKEFIIMHDATVDRTTDGKGDVSTLTLAEIKKLDAGSWFGQQFAGERVPTLRETLKAIKGKILPDLDFKAGDLAALVKLLGEEGYLTDGNVLFHGSRDDAKKITALTDKLLIRPAAFNGAHGLQTLIDDSNPPIINIDRGAFSEYYLIVIHQKGKLAFVNALRRGNNKKFMVRAIAAGADFLQSDKLDILIPLVQEHNKQAIK